MLRDYGNMSAPTVLFVLERLIKQRPAQAGDDDRLRPRLHLRRAAARSRVISASIAVLALVTLQRLVELWLSNGNTGRLLARGAHEAGAGHYPLIVGLHVAWLAALWWLAPGRPVDTRSWLLFAVLRAGRGSGCSRPWARAGRRGSSSVPDAQLSARPLPLRQPSQLSGRGRRDRGPAAGVRAVADRVHLLAAQRGRSGRPHPRRERARSAAKLFRLRVWRSAPISRLSPRHRQMPEAGAPRLRSERRLGFKLEYRVTDIADRREADRARGEEPRLSSSCAWR